MILYAGLMIFTGGHAYRHLVVANINVFDWEIFGAFWRDFGLCIIGHAPSLRWDFCTVPTTKHNDKNVVLLLYGIFTALFSVSIAKVGSSLNYVLELWAAVCMLIGLALQFPNYVQGSKIDVVGICIILLLYGWPFIFHVPWERQRVGNQRCEPWLGMWNDVAAYRVLFPFHYINPFSDSQVDVIKRNVTLYT